MENNKIYVKVEAIFNLDGSVVPKKIYWENGQAFEIDKILDVRPACSLHSGGAGTRYKIKIGQNIRFLFCEGQNVMKHHSFCKWFITNETY